MIYTEEELPQGSDRWLEFRRNTIGGSEIGVLTKDQSYFWNTPHEIFLNKIGKSYPESNEHMKRGNLLEDEARNFIKNYLNSQKNDKIRTLVRDISEFKIKEKCEPVQMTVVHKNNSKISASFDAVDLKNKLIWEIKCPTLKTFTKMTRARKVYKMYRSQTQQELFVANSHWKIKNLMFCYYHPEGTYYKETKTSNEKLIKLVILPTTIDMKFCKIIENTVEKFWKNIENKKWEENWKENEK